MAYAEKRGKRTAAVAGEVQGPRRRSQPVRLRDQAGRARLGPRPGGEGPRGHVDRSGSRRDHGQRMDRPLEGPAGRRPEHHGEPRVPDPPVHPAILGQAAAELAHRRGNRRLGAQAARHRGGIPEHGEGRAQPAAHHPRRRGSGKTPADPVQPRRPPAQPRAQDRAQARPQPAARVGDAAGGAARGRAGRAAGGPGRRVHHAGHDRLHRDAVGRDDRPGARPAAPGADQRRVAAQGDRRPLPPAPAQGRLLPQHEIRAARAGRPSRIPRRAADRPGRRSTQGSDAPAPPSTAGAAGTCSSAPTAATTGTATTRGGSSARPATDGTRRPTAGRAGWSSWTPRHGQASQSRRGRQPCPESHSTLRLAGAPPG